MPRPPARRGPAIRLDPGSSLPLYKQLYERLRGAILEGQLERGARLPSTRALASELGVSRNTTALAYELLLLEGFLESRVGRGTEVACRLPAPLLREHAERPPAAPVPIEPPRVAGRAAALRSIAYPDRGGETFRAGEPALDLFPYQLWARLVARRARQSLRQEAHYGDPAGYEPLREAIAAHIGITRGVRCAPEQIIMTAGAQGALDLAARTLLDPGDAVWMENPGYFGAQGALLSAGARLVPVPVDGEGLDVAAGRVRCPQARLASITPSHQFPTGVTMSLNRRLALLDWASETGGWILEDDFDSEFRFSGRPLEALQGLDRAGRVIYVGTFSKVLFPALRLGYLVAPAELAEPLLMTKRYINSSPPILEQMALTDFIREGHFVRHLRQMLQRYSRRRDILRDELQAQLGGLLDVWVPEAGMHMVGWLPAGADDRRAATLAAAADIDAAPLSRFGLAPLPRPGLLFGYANTSEEQIAPGVRRLAAALAQL